MAPRRRAARSGRDPPIASTAQIGCLPPELLLAVFAHVPLAERHRRLALVCRQWGELVHSPALLDSLEVSIGPARLLPRLRSFVEWLARRAVGHVRQLRLHIAAAEDLADGDWTEDESQEITASIAAAVTLLAGSLRQLSLSTHKLPLLPLGSWMVPLGRLANLEMTCRRDIGNVTVSAPLPFLTGLRSLRLHAPSGKVLVQPGAMLPPMLTSLWMRSFIAEAPQPVGALSCLRDLTIVGTSSTHSLGVLAALHSTLTALNLTVLEDIPDCLERLTELRSLTIDDYEGKLAEPDDQVLERALPQLRHLTAVYLFSGGLPDSPAALSSLQHLDTVCWSGWDNEPKQLPGGPWLGRLRRLAVSCWFLSDADSLATLSGAQHLEHLGVHGSFDEDGPRHASRQKARRSAEVAGILAWAQGHASLRQLALRQLQPRMARLAAAARRSRPELCIREAKDVFEAVCGYQCQETVYSDDDEA